MLLSNLLAFTLIVVIIYGIAIPITLLFRRFYEARNKKFRFGWVKSQLIMFSPFILLTLVMMILITLEVPVSSYVKIMNILFVVVCILLIINIKWLIVPIDKEKYENEKILKRKNYKGLKYYFINKPMETLVLSLVGPKGALKHIATLNKEKVEEDALKVLPKRIQFLSILLNFIITSVILFILVLCGASFGILLPNISVFLFVLINIILALIVDRGLNYVEILMSKHYKKSIIISDFIKYLTLVILYITTVCILFSFDI